MLDGIGKAPRQELHLACSFGGCNALYLSTPVVCSVDKYLCRKDS